MLKMDFGSSFLLPRMLVILAIIDGRACAEIERLNGITGSKIAFPLELQNQSHFSVVINGMNDLADCFRNGGQNMSLGNGFQDLENVAQSDEGMYHFFSQNENKTFFLRVFEPLPTIHIHCLPGGKAELSCEVGGLSGEVYWTLNGSHLNDSDICVKEGGSKIVLEKKVTGMLTCHRRNSPLNFSTELLCDDEDEKEEGITLSAISSEGPKSSPNGDHCEAADALADSTTNPGPGSSKIKAEMDPNSKVKPETEPGPQKESEAMTEFREVMVDPLPPEAVGDCFPETVDA
ncbi:uncharacterized protein LOC143839786 isoform X2 [Paroedura picta]|uniref:uncharacterized protein LOC143839786 isoform X2 n=1 Tax=Paroedura picta TaxID=143630 RepID=UPI0040578DD5